MTERVLDEWCHLQLLGNDNAVISSRSERRLPQQSCRRPARISRTPGCGHGAKHIITDTLALPGTPPLNTCSVSLCPHHASSGSRYRGQHRIKHSPERGTSLRQPTTLGHHGHLNRRRQRSIAVTDSSASITLVCTTHHRHGWKTAHCVIGIDMVNRATLSPRAFWRDIHRDLSTITSSLRPPPATTLPNCEK
jgi:hypothetical protein